MLVLQRKPYFSADFFHNVCINTNEFRFQRETPHPFAELLFSP